MMGFGCLVWFFFFTSFTDPISQRVLNFVITHLWWNNHFSNMLFLHHRKLALYTKFMFSLSKSINPPKFFSWKTWPTAFQPRHHVIFLFRLNRSFKKTSSLFVFMAHRFNSTQNSSHRIAYDTKRVLKMKLLMIFLCCRKCKLICIKIKFHSKGQMPLMLLSLIALRSWMFYR